MTAVTGDEVVASERPSLATIAVVARKELSDAVRDRTFWGYTLGFAAPAVALSLLALRSSEAAGYGGFGRTGASLVALAQLVVPLMGLTSGAQALAGRRERDVLRFLLSHPVSRTEVFLGVYAGRAVALSAAVAGGFGVAGLVASWRGGVIDAGALLSMAALSWLLTLAMLGTGMLISVVVRASGTALGLAFVVWLVLVFVGDLGMMGTAIATRLPVGALLTSVLVNPVEAFRLAAILSLQGSLDVLGPAGNYATDRFGDSVRSLLVLILVGWAVVPTVAAGWGFHRRADL